MNYETAALADILKQNCAYTIVDDNDVAFVCRYIGDEASATVTIASGDITFQHGDLASESVDSTINSDDDPGVIDVSDAGGDTMAEAVALINASANWEAVLVDALGGDATTTVMLLDVGETTLTPNTEFMVVNKDTSATLNLAKLCSYRGLEVHKGVTVGAPFAGDTNYYITLNKIISTNTFGSGTSIITVVDIDPVTLDEVTLYTRAGGATTVEQEIDFFTDFGGLSALAKGHMLLVKMTGEAACTGELHCFWTIKEY